MPTVRVECRVLRHDWRSRQSTSGRCANIWRHWRKLIATKHPEEHLADGSGGTLDGRARRTGVLRLLHQLPDRHRRGHHGGCRGDAGHTTDEVNATKTMIERVEDALISKPDRLIGDIAYGSAEILGWMVNEKQIEPHVPVWDKTQRKDETLSSSDFQWNEQADEYRCPQGHALRSQWRAIQQSALPTSPRPTPSSIDPANPIARLAR